MKFYLKIMLLVVFLAGQTWTQELSCPDLNQQIQPILIAPKNQAGYGNGQAQLAQPDDVELLSDGRMIVSDVNNNRIQVFSADGEIIQSLYADDLELSGEINPTGLSEGQDGSIYISCEGSGTVVKLNADLSLEQHIGQPSKFDADQYYSPDNSNGLFKPQGLIVSNTGDVFVIDMDDRFRKGYDGVIRNFGFKKFKRVNTGESTSYQYDTDFARTQEITSIMRKSEGMAIDEKRSILFIAEEKPLMDQFKNKSKYRYIAAFDLLTGKFLNKLYGVTYNNGKILSGLFTDSIEGLAIYENYLFAVDEKNGKIYIFDIDSGDCLGSIGRKAKFYCDDHSDCEIDGINYNEQNIAAGTAKTFLKNSWQNNELASPDGISAAVLNDQSKRLALVDQWNMRILVYDLDQILDLLSKNEK